MFDRLFIVNTFRDQVQVISTVTGGTIQLPVETWVTLAGLIPRQEFDDPILDQAYTDADEYEVLPVAPPPGETTPPLE